MNAYTPILMQTRRRALRVGAIGLILCILGVLFSRDHFFRSYLFAYSFWFGIAMGCLGLLMLHNLVGGAWGDVIRPLLEAGSLTLPWLALLFLPLLFGLRVIYPWARPDVIAADIVLQHKHIYLNVPFFIVRAVVYFGIWVTMALRLDALSFRAGNTSDPEVADLPRRRSAPGLFIYFVTLTFALVDWQMSLEPHWYSTVYESMVIMGFGLGALAFVICVLRFLQPTDTSIGEEAAKPFVDLGNILLTFVMFWAYLEFSQYIIIWSGNIPEEISWYLHRQQGGWFWVAMALISFQFIFPFLALLGRGTKQRLERLSGVAVIILIIHLVDVFWLVEPPFHPSGFSLHWLDLIAPVAIGAFWVAAFVARLETRPSPIGRYVPEVRS